MTNPIEIVKSYYEKAKDPLWKLGAYATATVLTVGGGAGGAYVGHKASDAVVPDAKNTFGNVLEYSAEITAAGLTGAAGALIGFATASWITDGGLIEFLEG